MPLHKCTFGDYISECAIEVDAGWQMPYHLISNARASKNDITYRKSKENGHLSECYVDLTYLKTASRNAACSSMSPSLRHRPPFATGSSLHLSEYLVFDLKWLVRHHTIIDLVEKKHSIQDSLQPGAQVSSSPKSLRSVRITVRGKYL
jgi:hypothetical protein